MKEKQPGATKAEEPKAPVAKPQEPTTTEPIDTSGWKTYRNEEYGSR